MKRIGMIGVCAVAVVVAVMGVGQTKPGGGVLPVNAGVVEGIVGVKGVVNAGEGTLKVSFPRTDVEVRVDGTKMPPFMGLTSWATFQNGVSAEAMVMGDFVLFQDEVNPVMSEALANGLEVTALHNHFFYSDPPVFFMHIGGEGTTSGLATGVSKMLAKVKEIRAGAAVPAKTFGYGALAEKSSVSAKPLDDIFGVKGMVKDGMYKAVFGRTVKMPCGCDVGKEMGVMTWAAFYGMDDHAVVDGDFIATDGELQGVLKSLRGSGINVVAIHNHMADETPRQVFLHYWGVGAAGDLARGVRGALDTQK